MGLFSKHKDSEKSGAEKESKLKSFFRHRSRSRSPVPPGKSTPEDTKTISASANGGTVTTQSVPKESASVTNGTAQPPVTETTEPSNSNPSNDEEETKPKENETPKSGELVAPIELTEDLSKMDPWSAAFAAACITLSDSQKQELSSARGLRELFAQLGQADEDHLSESWFRKGLRKLAPVLQTLNFCIDLTSPFAGADPSAATAFTIIKSVMTIAIGICGAEAQFEGQIQALLEHVKIIDRCDEILQSDGAPLKSIFEMLTLIYKDLLDFYFEVLGILKSSSFFVGLMKSRFKDRLGEITGSFSGHTEQLERFIDLETLNVVRAIQSEQINDKVRTLLDSRREKEAIYHNLFRQRADGACAWITTSPDFCQWLKLPDTMPTKPGTDIASKMKSIIMFGRMGSGKSVTASFVVDYLASNPELSGYPKPIICSYYCKDDNETNKVLSIYRSILSQLLAKREQLKPKFEEWYKKTKPKIPVDPTLSEDAMRELLVDIIQSLTRRVYLVIDGMDECESADRRHLLEFFNNLFTREAPLNVFLSSRPDEYIKTRMPPDTTVIEMKTSLDRDRAIASHLVSRCLDDYSEELRSLVTDHLAEKADGSAIWVKIVVDWLQRAQIKSKGRILKELQGIPSPQSLSELYLRLFKETADGVEENERIIEIALETMAAAGRTLTMDELAHAVFMRCEDEEFADLVTLEDFVDAKRLEVLITPFVTLFWSDGKGKGKGLRLLTVRLVHQSLKELIDRQAPADWKSSKKSVSAKVIEQRRERMNGALLDTCVNYLLFEEFGENELFPKNKAEELEADAFMMGGFGADDDDDDAVEEPSAADPETSITADIDPVEAGFGKFFHYAACYWPFHFKNCTPDTLPKIEDILALSVPNSKRLRNWVEIYCRPNLTTVPERDPDFEDLDVLVVTSFFGPPCALTALLAQGVDEQHLQTKSAINAMKWTLQYGNTMPVKMLIQDAKLGAQLRFLQRIYDVIKMWVLRILRMNDDPAPWNELFNVCITTLLAFPDSRSELFEWGNELLCVAAEHGCLPIIQTLFSIGASVPELKTSILGITPREWHKGRQSLHEVLFMTCHEDVVDFLLSLPDEDIGPHIRHRAVGGDTIFHVAAEAPRAEVIRKLIQRWPEGVDLLRDDGSTPFQLLLFSQGRDVDAARVFLREGKVDLDKGVQEEEDRALRRAVRNGYLPMVRCLVEDGDANVTDALVVEEDGSVRLRDKLTEPDEVKEREMLEELKRLLERQMARTD